MSKTMKLLLGLVTLWPFAYLILFFLLIFSMILFIGPGQGDPGSGPPRALALIFPLHLLTMLVIAALTVFYIVNVFRNERVVKDQKVLWAVVLFLGNVLAMPIYWYLYIWKEGLPAAASTPGQLGSADTSAWTTNATHRQEQEQYVPPSQPPNWRD
jgi:hypothetical protein